MVFETDIFISYAHIDDQPLIEGQQGWISKFHRALEVRVSQLLGKAPRMWRDPKLQGNDIFGDTLVQKLPEVALLVSVISPRYTRSEWCQREVEEFLKAAERSGGARIGNKSRLMKVVKTPVPPPEQNPAEMQQLLGYEFYTVDPVTGRPRELDQAFGDDVQLQYWAKLDDLAYDICQQLQALEATGPAAAPAAAEETVYLAFTSYDLKQERQELRRYLERRGHRVLPDRPLPQVADEIRDYVREQLAQSRLSIHPIGGNYGVIPDGATESVVVMQNDLAIARCAEGGLSRLIWIAPHLEAQDERQQAFLKALRTDPSAHRGADVLETSLEQLKMLARDVLEPSEPPAIDRAEPAGDEELTRIYLICDQRDQETTAELEDDLFDRGFEVILPIFDDDEAVVRQEHEETLRYCDAVLVYYGAGGELWMRRKLREIQRSAALGRAAPLLAQAIYVAPPETPQKARLRTRQAIVLQQQGSFESASLKPFLDRIVQARAS